jgi:SAM-dependent methyltransferase
VQTVAGRAESIPLPEASLDAAIAAQAYHWFTKERAHAELARVIRPGGVFGAIWNNRDESAAWVAEYSRIVEGDRGPDDAGADSGRTIPSFGDHFGPTATAVFHHSVRHTEESLVQLLKSRSYFLTASGERQAALEADVRELARTHPDLAGRDEFDLPYETLAYRATRLA